MIRLGRALRLLAALAALVAATASPAFATTYDHGKTVWFSDLSIGDGDEVDGNLDVVFGSATCGDGAVVHGDVRTFGGSFRELDGCQIDGRVVQAFGDPVALGGAPWLGPLSSDQAFVENRRFLEKLAWDVVVVVAFLLFPMRVRVALDRVEKHPGLGGLAGAIALVAAIPIAVLLAVTIIGIPLIALEIAGYFAGLWIGTAAVAIVIGRRLHELVRPHGATTPLGALGLGLVVVTAAETVPAVGWAVAALVALVGLGSALLAFVPETAFRSFTHGSAPTIPPANRPA